MGQHDTGISLLLNMYVAFWVSICIGVIAYTVYMKLKPRKKYRVGKKQKRAILEIETGHEYLVFPEGARTDHVEIFCKWLNKHGK